jgi:hypothetical protein
VAAVQAKASDRVSGVAVVGIESGEIVRGFVRVRCLVCFRKLDT